MVPKKELLWSPWVYIIRGTLFGVLIIRILIFRVLY